MFRFLTMPSEGDPTLDFFQAREVPENSRVSLRDLSSTREIVTGDGPPNEKTGIDPSTYR